MLTQGARGDGKQAVAHEPRGDAHDRAELGDEHGGEHHEDHEGGDLNHAGSVYYGMP